MLINRVELSLDLLLAHFGLMPVNLELSKVALKVFNSIFKCSLGLVSVDITHISDISAKLFFVDKTKTLDLTIPGESTPDIVTKYFFLKIFDIEVSQSNAFDFLGYL